MLVITHLDSFCPDSSVNDAKAVVQVQEFIRAIEDTLNNERCIVVLGMIDSVPNTNTAVKDSDMFKFHKQ